MDKLSTIIITNNEEQNIAATLDAAWKVSDEIIVVDSGSTDQTENICIKKGVTFITQDWLGFGNQRNFAVSKTANDYILVLDADEVLDDRLIESIQQVKKEGFKQSIYQCRRLNFYYGKFIRHGMENPDIKVRLYHKSFAKWNDKLVHEDLVFDSTLATSLLKGYLLHYTYRNVSEHSIKMDRYSSLSAAEYFKAGKKDPGFIKLTISPIFTFIKAFILRGGFLDGWRGWLLAVAHANTTLQKYAKLKMIYLEQKQSAKDK